jgi:hypothetical protein
VRERLFPGGVLLTACEATLGALLYSLQGIEMRDIVRLALFSFETVDVSRFESLEGAFCDSGAVVC